MALKVTLNLQTPPAEYDYAAEVVVGRNSFGVLIGHTPFDTPTSIQTLQALQDDVVWELKAQQIGFDSIEWIVNEVSK